MINSLIPSKDRACQLRLLLESIKQNANDIFTKIHILYTASNDEYQAGYLKLQEEEILDNIEWQREKDFTKDFIAAINDYSSDYICGIVDDCVFYKKLPSGPELIENIFEKDVFCFSFRMGLNTVVQNYLLPDHRFELTNSKITSHFVKWNWLDWDSRLNYGYPISLDGHIYRGGELAELTAKYEFPCLRDWEGILAGKTRRGGKVFDETNNVGDHMVAYRQNVLFSIPCNCVQDPPLISGQINPHTESDLNKRYLDGEVIDLNALESMFQNVSWCHNEIPLSFKFLHKEYEYARSN